jgi:hypothetical protein
VFEPGKTLFNWVQVRRVWWKIEELDPTSIQVNYCTEKKVTNPLCIASLFHCVDVMDTAVVEDQNTPWSRIRVLTSRSPSNHSTNWSPLYPPILMWV